MRILFDCRSLAALLLIAAVGASRADDAVNIAADRAAADRMRADVAYLASDELQGRGPGTRGEEMTTNFLAKQFKAIGLKPVGDRGTYFQAVPLISVATSPQSKLSASIGNQSIDFTCEKDFAGQSHMQQEAVEFDAEAVFVGHGITAPEYDWDDYKGIDVKGKIVVLFTNEPPSDDPMFFGGKALTYYGRWTYKFEEATRRGAKACFIIHTNETAGYPYSVVQPLDGIQIQREPNQHELAFAGWLSKQAGDRLLALSNRNVDAALKEANTRGFKAFSLGSRIKGEIPTRIAKIVTKNVVGMIEGSDPVLKSEVIAFTAHWDHLGVGKAVIGDSIYNGAADNATGCALILEIARTWAALPVKPKRSALFLAVTAEEKGLLGSLYYSKNPIVPLGKTALDLNFDMVLPLGVPESIVVNGSERTTAKDMVYATAKKHSLEIEPDSRAHLGVYYRSDHFSFARAGVPAFSVAAGDKVKGMTVEAVKKAKQDFNDKAYHSPQDEIQPSWDFSGFPRLVHFARDVAIEAANAEKLPTWNAGDEFLPARVKSGVK